MSVEDWARREAASMIPVPAGASQFNSLAAAQRDAMAHGIVHAFDALLSDEAVEAMVREWWALRESGPANLPLAMRAALQAAITAVTGEKNE